MSEYLAMAPVKKARLTLDYLSSNGGLMPEEVVDRFLKVMIPTSDFLKSSTTVKMKSTTFRIPTWEFGSRALHKKTRGQALPDAQRTTPTTAGPTITAYGYTAEIPIEGEAFDSAVDNAGLMNLVMSALTERVGTDAAEIALNSDTSSSDADLDYFDGFYTAVTTNTAAAGSTRLNRTNMTTLFKSLPSQYAKPTMTVRTGVNSVTDFRNSMGDRPTSKGDTEIDRWGFSSDWNTMMIKGDPVIPQNLGAGNDTIAVMCDEKNYHVGFHRKMTPKMEEYIREDVITVVFTVRMGGAWAVEKQAAKLTGLLAS